MDTEHETLLARAPEIRLDEVRWRFISDYYDGPISGLLDFRGRMYRFCCFPEDIPDQRIYVLHELSPEELTDSLRCKARFEELVGTHWSFDDQGKPLPSVARKPESVRQFYEGRTRTPAPHPQDKPIVAWFVVGAGGREADADDKSTHP